MTHTLTRTFSLDADDGRSINEAIARFQAIRRELPEGTSDLAGAILGEICRDWLEGHPFIERRAKP